MRKLKWFWQRITRGFDDRECWGLDFVFAEYMLPRIKRFRQLDIGTPGELTWDQWSNITWKIQRALELIIKDEHDILTPDEEKQVEEGLELLVKYFRALWY